MDGGRWAQHRGKTVSLAKLTEAYVQRSLEKPKKIQRGNWERHLSMDMQECKLLMVSTTFVMSTHNFSFSRRRK